MSFMYRTSVCIEHPPHQPAVESHTQRIQRLVRAATGAKAIRKAQEVHFINLVEDGHHGRS